MDKKYRIIEQHKAGVTITDIVKHQRTSKQYVHKVLKKYWEELKRKQCFYRVQICMEKTAIYESEEAIFESFSPKYSFLSLSQEEREIYKMNIIPEPLFYPAN
jgi:hypothetical protein